MLDKNKIYEDIDLAYKNMIICQKENQLSSCSECRESKRRECFSYHFYNLQYDLLDLIQDEN